MRWFIHGLAILCALGCDNSINPISEAAEGVFAVYGYLDTAADTQFVRIEGLRDSAFGTDDSVDGVEVTSTGGSEGIRLWQESPVSLDGGGIGHVYFSVFPAEPGKEYALRVGPPNGPATEARVRMPPIPRLSTDPPQGDSLSLVQSIGVLGVDREPLKLTVLYEVRGPSDAEPTRIPIDYGKGGTATARGWEFDVFLSRDRSSVMAALQRDQADRDVEMVSLQVFAELRSPEWDDEGDPSNITSGLGFFGAVGRFNLGWQLSPEFVSVLGYVDAQ
jgi:hypothetical protein